MVSRAINISLAIIITFSLFVAIPVAHNLFGFKLEAPKGFSRRAQIPIENLPPQKKEEKKAEAHLRRMQSESMNKALAGAQRSMAMKFSPDLSVEGNAQGAAVDMKSQELQAEIFEEGQTDENAVPLSTPSIEYPERARELGIQGTLEVVFVIDINGSVQAIDIRKSPHPTISSEARAVIAKWKFKPAKNRGIPVKVRVRQEIEFKLD